MAITLKHLHVGGHLDPHMEDHRHPHRHQPGAAEPQSQGNEQLGGHRGGRQHPVKRPSSHHLQHRVSQRVAYGVAHLVLVADGAIVQYPAPTQSGRSAWRTLRRSRRRRPRTEAAISATPRLGHLAAGGEGHPATARGRCRTGPPRPKGSPETPGCGGSGSATRRGCWPPPQRRPRWQCATTSQQSSAPRRPLRPTAAPRTALRAHWGYHAHHGCWKRSW